jgi:hypothetical protein
MSTLKHGLRVEVNVSVDGPQEMAGFEVSINGRFWVSAEGQKFRGSTNTASWLPDEATARGWRSVLSGSK